ncbi:MAG: transglycosylase SLT domain-containing protein [Proteobacteria bacterium]|nr:transglycosylase SLT domain-containing protein [Pseudomonadota bacterium]
MVFFGQNKHPYVLIVSFLLLILSCHSSREPHVIVKTVNTGLPDVFDYESPESVRLCGEIIDLTDPVNQEMFDREFIISVWDIPQVLMWLKRSGRFFPYFEERLAERNLPDDLKYLAIAESSLHTHIKSKAGALGIWQLMEKTARRYGLQVDRAMMDERLCYERSTDASLAYLEELKGMFNSWLLSMAAYNCGENQLNKALKNQTGKDYFSLDLPRETERYIFRIAAIKYIMENPERFGFKVDETKFYKPIVSSRIDVDINDRFYISDLSELTGISYKTFMELNPKIISPLLPLGSYSLHIPPGFEKTFQASLEKLRDPVYRKKHSYDSRYYVVQDGDVLSSISWETGVPVNTIKKLNHIRGSHIQPGQKLLIRK